MLGCRALPAGRIAALGATMDLHHGLLVVTPAVLEFTGISKDYHGLRPLRIAELRVAAGEPVTQRHVAVGRDAHKAESGAAGIGLAHPLVNLLERVAHIREAVPLAREGIGEILLGQGLKGSTAVSINGVAATSFNVFSDTYMTAVVPSVWTDGEPAAMVAGTMTSAARALSRRPRLIVTPCLGGCLLRGINSVRPPEFRRIPRE